MCRHIAILVPARARRALAVRVHRGSPPIGSRVVTGNAFLRGAVLRCRAGYRRGLEFMNLLHLPGIPSFSQLCAFVRRDRGQVVIWIICVGGLDEAWGSRIDVRWLWCLWSSGDWTWWDDRTLRGLRFAAVGAGGWCFDLGGVGSASLASEEEEYDGDGAEGEDARDDYGGQDVG